MTYVPQIDETACAAHGDCAEIAPWSSASTMSPTSSGPDPTLILKAAEACPSVAITVVDDPTGRRSTRSIAPR